MGQAIFRKVRAALGSVGGTSAHGQLRVLRGLFKGVAPNPFRISFF